MQPFKFTLCKAKGQGSKNKMIMVKKMGVVEVEMFVLLHHLSWRKKNLPCWQDFFRM